MTKTRFLIIADDLTGACDAAAPFAAVGLSTWVTWQIEDANEPAADVVSFSSNSRADDPSLAAKKVEQIVPHLPELKAASVFKKIDSTLKGNWVAETNSVLDKLRMKAAVVAPAFPVMGRQIVHGRLAMGGMPTAESPSVISIIHNENCSAPIHISLKELRCGAKRVANVIAASLHENQFFVVDSTLDSDLDIVADAMKMLGRSILPVGSGGLAASIARQARFGSDSTAIRTIHNDVFPFIPAVGTAPRSVIVFAGSANARTEEQLIALVESKMAIEFSHEAKSLSQQHRTPSPSPSPADGGGGLGINIKSGGDVSSIISSGTPIVIRVDWTAPTINFIDAMIGVCRRSSIAGIVLTGGDTAQLVCGRCSARGIWLKGEIEPGIPWGNLRGGALDGVPVVTKAGGFGDSTCLVRAINFLQKSVGRCPEIPTFEE